MLLRDICRFTGDAPLFRRSFVLRVRLYAAFAA